MSNGEQVKSQEALSRVLPRRKKQQQLLAPQQMVGGGGDLERIGFVWWWHVSSWMAGRQLALAGFASQETALSCYFSFFLRADCER